MEEPLSTKDKIVYHKAGLGLLLDALVKYRVGINDVHWNIDGLIIDLREQTQGHTIDKKMKTQLECLKQEIEGIDKYVSNWVNAFDRKIRECTKELDKIKDG